MNKLLKLEEVAQFALGIWIFSTLDYAWWWFPALILVPDFSMLGYLSGPKTGAYVYNFFHHKLPAVFVLISGYLLGNQSVQLAGVILFSHAAMDRIFGYGLKYTTGFHHTHLGTIGNKHE
jgi:hypothetical protein